MAKTNITMHDQLGDLFDWSTFLITTLLIAAGLISIYSATYESGMSLYFNRQLIYTGVGIAVMIFVMYLPEKLLQRTSVIIYASTLVLLFIVLFSREVYGTRGWISLGPLTIQPSEFAKVATLLLVARELSYKGRDIKTIRDFGIVFLIFAVPIFFILLQPDYGSATVLMAIFLGILLWSGFDIYILFFIVTVPVIIILSLLGITYYVAGAALFALLTIFFRRKITLSIAAIIIVVAVGYTSPVIIDKLMPHQKDRIETFLNPGSDPRGKGYNVIQSIMAVGSGGVTGKGFLQGTQTQLRYIPKQWTDFIFCVPTEEFGFAGGVLVLGLLTALVLRAVRIAYEIESKFFSLLCFGAGTMFFYHTMVNVGMAIGLMPVMGIPLPFLSAGGSSLIANMATVGLLLNAYRSYRKGND